jgi:hypothetical protein
MEGLSQPELRSAVEMPFGARAVEEPMGRKRLAHSSALDEFAAPRRRRFLVHSKQPGAWPGVEMRPVPECRAPSTAASAGGLEAVGFARHS